MAVVMSECVFGKVFINYFKVTVSFKQFPIVLFRYFSFRNVLRGFEVLTQRLYNITFSVSAPEFGEIWQGNVIKIVSLLVLQACLQKKFFLNGKIEFKAGSKDHCVVAYVIRIPLQMCQDVVQGENQFLGTIYVDLENRMTKASGDCHFTVRCSKQVISEFLVYLDKLYT